MGIAVGVFEFYWRVDDSVKCYFHLSAPLASRWYSHGKQETDEEFDARWVTYFNKADIDAWELRKGKSLLEGTRKNLIIGRLWPNIYTCEAKMANFYG